MSQQHRAQLVGKCSICSAFFRPPNTKRKRTYPVTGAAGVLPLCSAQVIDYFSYDTAKRAGETGGTSARKQKKHHQAAAAGGGAVRINKMRSCACWPAAGNGSNNGQL